MSNTVAIAVAAAGLGAGLLISIIVIWRAGKARRTTRRKIASLVTRLDSAETGARIEHRMPIGQALELLESAVESMTLGGDVGRSDIERLSRGLENLDLGLMIVDEQNELVAINAEARRYIDGRRDEAVAQARIQELLAQALDGDTSDEELEIFGPPHRNLQIAARPLHDGKRNLGAMVVVTDATEARRTETMRRDFIANVSHELKTPVGAIALTAEILADETDPAISRRLASRIEGESTRLARVIDDLLDLSRLETELAPPREPVALGLVMAEAAERIRAVAADRHISVSLWEPEPVAVMGERRQLVSAAANLLANAVAYSEPGSVVEIGAAATDAGVDFWVADEGVGIPEPDIPRIFERFYRVDRGRSRDSGGTGLGLSIVRHVAHNHGATIDVVSREGEGSRFTVRFPERVVSSQSKMPPGITNGNSAHHADVAGRAG